MKISSLVVLLVAVAVASAALTYLVYSDFSVIEVKQIAVDANFTSANNVGFNLDKDMMHFGKIPLGGSGERSFEISNTKNFPISAKIYATGSISRYIDIKDNNIRLRPGETRQITAIAYAPLGAEKTGYTGTIRIEIRWSPI